VNRDRRLVGEIGQRRGIAREDVVDGTALLGQMRAADPGREIVGGVLLHEATALDAVRKALKGERPALDLPQHDRRHPPVVVDHIALGQPGLGKKDLAGVRELDPPPVDLEYLAGPDVRHHNRVRSRPTSRGGSPHGSPGKRRGCRPP
jgi:hypothetical protein